MTRPRLPPARSGRRRDRHARHPVRPRRLHPPQGARASSTLLLTALGIALLTLLVLMIDVIVEGAGSLTPEFFTETPSRIDPSSSGIAPAIWGTIWLMVVCAAFIIPVGVASAIYLEEYANRENRFARFVEVNIQNLAAVPSIVYGVLGPRLPRSRAAQPGQRRPGRRADPGPAGAARRHRGGARGDPRRAAVDPRGLDGARGDASGRRSGSRCCRPRSPAWRRGSSSRSRARSARRRPLIVVGATAFATTASTGLFEALLGAADSDLRLDRRPAGGVPGARGGRDHRPDGDPAEHERGRHLATKSLRTEVVGE